MAGIFAGASRALLTSIIFAFETTQQADALLPLLAGCTVAYLVSFFLMKHTIMTEKIARRGVNTPHSYVPDIMDATTIGEIATRDVRVLNGNNTIAEVRKWIETGRAKEEVPCFPVVNDEGSYMGTVSFKQIYSIKNNPDAVLLSILNHSPVTIYEDNTLRIAVDLMVKERIDVLAVVDRNNKERITGIVTHRNILEAYRLEKEENETASRSISLRGGGIKMILLGRSLLKHSAKTDV
jgi:CBS domain-containing protein